MAQFPVILHLITSPYFRPAAVTPQLITDLGAFLTLTAAGGPGSGAQAALAEFKATLMHVLEALCQQTELVLQHYEVRLGWVWGCSQSNTTRPTEHQLTPAASLPACLAACLLTWCLFASLLLRSQSCTRCCRQYAR